MIKPVYLSSLLLILLTFCTIDIFSQTPTTQGTEFFCSFMKNGYRNCNGSASNDKLSVIASAPRATTVTVSNPNTSWSQSFSVPANGVNSILVNEIYCYSTNSEVVENKGLLITATDTISLFIGNEATNSFDASNVLPINALADKYMTQNITPMTMANASLCYNINRSVFIIVATEDNTIVDITPKCRTQGNHAPNTTFNVTLNRGQTYQVQSQTGGTSGDFSGTLIQARDCKKIAVFNGVVATAIPTNETNGRDHIFEQTMPTDYWGKRFVITSSLTRQRSDQIKVTALMNNTEIRKDGTLVSTLQSGNSYEFSLGANPGACYIETSGPCAVNLYQVTGDEYDPQDNGDPSMVWISPVEQQIKDITFSTFQAQSIVDHFVNIVTKTDEVNSLLLNGNPITTPFEVLTADPTLSYSKVTISPGAHHLSSDAGFTAHVYGFGQAQGYAYTVGSSTVVLNRDIAIEGIPSAQFPEGFALCMDDTLLFSIVADFEYDTLTWNFGDGSVICGDSVYYTYSEPGNYDITVSIKFTYANCYGSVYDTIVLPMTVGHTYLISDTLNVCESDFPFTHLGLTIYEEGYYYSDEQTVYGCDSIINLLVISHPKYEVTYEDMICMKESYDRYGFSLPIHFNPGMYYYSNRYQTENYGCDSIVNLILRVSDISVEIPAPYPEFCDGKKAELIANTLKSFNVTGYLWSTGEKTPEITILDPGKYSVTVSDYHCLASNEIFIDRCPLNLFLPNTITPTRPDGINDFFSLSTTEDIAEVDIVIFDRSGNLIFQSNDPSFKWDGSTNGKFTIGCYNYVLTVVEISGKRHRFTGVINVI